MELQLSILIVSLKCNPKENYSTLNLLKLMGLVWSVFLQDGTDRQNTAFLQITTSLPFESVSSLLLSFTILGEGVYSYNTRLFNC